MATGTAFAVVWEDRAIPRAVFPTKAAAEQFARLESRRNDTDYNTVAVALSVLSSAEVAGLHQPSARPPAASATAFVTAFVTASATADPIPESPRSTATTTAPRVLGRPIWTPYGLRWPQPPPAASAPPPAGVSNRLPQKLPPLRMLQQGPQPSTTGGDEPLDSAVCPSPTDPVTPAIDAAFVTEAGAAFVTDAAIGVEAGANAVSSAEVDAPTSTEADDVDLIRGMTGAPAEEVRRALEKHAGDIAKAISELM